MGKKDVEKEKAIQDQEETDEQMVNRIQSPSVWRENVIEKMASERDALLKDETFVVPPTEEEILLAEKEEKEGDDKEDNDKAPDQNEDEEETRDDEFDVLNVSGEEVKVPKSKVYDAGKRSLQKEMAADKKLEEAGRESARIIENAKAEAQKLLDEAMSQKPTTLKKTEDIPVDHEKIKQRSRELIETIQYGDADEAAEALAQILSESTIQRPLLDDKKGPDLDIPREIERAFDRREVLINVKLPPEQGGYSDLLEDPDLEAMYNNKINAKLKEGSPNKWDTYKQAGDEVRAWLKKIAGSDGNNEKKEGLSTEGNDDLKNRREKKQQMADPIRPAHTRQTTEKVEKPETAADIIADIRKSRGQPIY